MVAFHDEVSVGFESVQHPGHVLFSNGRWGVEPRACDEVVNRILEPSCNKVVHLILHRNTVTHRQTFALSFPFNRQIEHVGLPTKACGPYGVSPLSICWKQGQAVRFQVRDSLRKPCIGLLPVGIRLQGKPPVPSAGIRACIGVHSSSSVLRGAVIMPCSSTTSQAPGSTASRSSVGKPVVL